MGRRPRVLIVCSYFPPMKAPEATHARFLAERLAAGGVDVHLVTSAEAGRSRAQPFTLHPVVTDWGWGGLGTVLGTLQRVRPDAVLLLYIGWLYGHRPMASVLPVVGRLTAPRARFVTLFENVLPDRRRWPRPVRWLLRRLGWRGGVADTFGLLFASDRYVFLCEQHRQAAGATAPWVRDRSAVIPAPPLMTVVPAGDGAARTAGRARLGVKDELVVLYFGYIYRSKGVDTLLRAAAAARPRLGRFRLVFVGGELTHDTENRGYGAEVRGLARDLGLDDVTTWAGRYESDEDASVLLRAADLCVLPFDSGVRLNNSSFAVAVTHRLPVVSTAGPDLEPQFAHGENVWLCPPRDPGALADALAALAADPGLRDRLRAGAGRLADEWFSWDKVVYQTNQVLFG